MQSGWVDRDAQAVVDRYAHQGVGPDLALRIYSTRLLGRDPKLVLHGGGNTSVKTVLLDLIGEEAEVLCVKGTGVDMAAIEPAGFPAVRLKRLRKLRERTALADEDMVRIKRENLLDPMAPEPSIEIMMHAFLPHKFIDHTHASAVLSLVDQADGELICTDVYKGRVGIVPYVMPGFGLAIKAAEIYEAKPNIEGLILHKHGIVTFAGSAREAYERMIALVTLAEERLNRDRKAVFVTAQLPQQAAAPSEVGPILRGAMSLKDERIDGAWRRMILDFRATPAVLNYVNGAEVARYSQAGVVTPDHTIRTKNWPLVVARARARQVAWSSSAPHRRRSRLRRSPTRATSPATTRASATSRPCSIRCRGWRSSPASACSASARASATPASPPISRKPRSRPSRTPRRSAASNSIPEADMFDMEYWALEQAKLGKGPTGPLAGQIAVVTGAGGAIGVATAKALRRGRRRGGAP